MKLMVASIPQNLPSVNAILTCYRRSGIFELCRIFEGFIGYMCNILACRPVARQQISTMHQWTNWEAVFSARSVRHLRDATIKELLEAAFSMQSMPR
jgi:hypothetical protein